jgi:hypothetical protein
VRTPLGLILPALALAAGTTCAREGLADPPDSRFGLIPLVGTGVAAVTAAGTLPSVFGYTTIGGELFGQLTRWGLFLRFDFLSSGGDGPPKASYQSGWNAYSFDAGASYRLFGDSQTLSLFARGGVTYEHWLAQEQGACSVLLFVPNGCVSEGSTEVGYEGDAIGVNAGARLELPLKSFYVAVGASFIPLVTFNTSNDMMGVRQTALQPGDVFQLRIDLSFGLRDTRGNHLAIHDYNEQRSKY